MTGLHVKTSKFLFQRPIRQPGIIKGNTNMEKIMYDTDIGSDIDDAVCLAYLLSQPECELLGITTVSGEPERRDAFRVP